MKSKHFNTLFKYGKYVGEINKINGTLFSAIISVTGDILFNYFVEGKPTVTIDSNFESFSHWLETIFKNGN